MGFHGRLGHDTDQYAPLGGPVIGETPMLHPSIGV
jgi:hypothetical protein